MKKIGLRASQPTFTIWAGEVLREASLGALFSRIALAGKLAGERRGLWRKLLECLKEEKKKRLGDIDFADVKSANSFLFGITELPFSESNEAGKLRSLIGCTLKKY